MSARLLVSDGLWSLPTTFVGPTPPRVTSPGCPGAEGIDVPVSYSAGKDQSIAETAKPALVYNANGEGLVFFPLFQGPKGHTSVSGSFPPMIFK